MTRHEPVALKRPVEAILVPSGERSTIPEGEWVTVQQTFGGQFTAMTMRGGIVRIDGRDADALGDQYVEEARKAGVKASSKTPATRARSAPDRIRSGEARAPSSSEKASTRIDLPLPVSPRRSTVGAGVPAGPVTRVMRATNPRSRSIAGEAPRTLAAAASRSR